MILTLPDPIESGQRHEFDRALEAAMRAVESTGYLRANFFLPWTGDSPARTTDCTDQVPGLLLFRRTKDPSELLGLLVVGETPTSGPSRAQLRVALELASAFPLHHEKPIALLAPYFSGSAMVLADALDRWAAAWPTPMPRVPSFVLRTGTASAMPLQEMQERWTSPHGSKLDVRALTLKSETLLRRYYTFLEDRYSLSGSELRGVALLAEAGTAYGGAAKLGNESDSRAPDPSPRPEFVLHFPRGIAELRSRWEARLGVESSESQKALTKFATPTFLRADYDDAAARDQPLSLSDETSVSDDLVLTASLKTLAQHGVRHIGIVATSVADAIFLARQVRLYLPDARLFVLQSDQLLTHPEHEASLLGATVVSSYPLANYGADWVYPFFPNRNTPDRFSRNAAHGVYNAALTLLAGDQDTPTPAVTAYTQPFTLPASDENLVPAIWISAIGHGGMWPLAVLSAASGDAEPYTIAIAPDSSDRVPVNCKQVPILIRPPTAWRLGITFILFICGVLVVGYVFAVRGKTPNSFHLFEAFRPHLQMPSDTGEPSKTPVWRVQSRRRNARSQSVLLIAVGILFGALVHLLVIASIPGWANMLPAARNVCAKFSQDYRDVWVPVMVAILLSIVLVRAHWDGQAPPPVDASQSESNAGRYSWRAVSVVWFVLIVAMNVGAILLLSAASSQSGWLPEQGALALYYARTTALTSRLSTLGPLLLQAAGGLLTAGVYLEYERIRSAACLPGSVPPTSSKDAACLPRSEPPTSSKDVAKEPARKDMVMQLAGLLVRKNADDNVEELTRALGSPMEGNRPKLAAAALALIPVAVFVTQEPSTIEGPWGSVGLIGMAVVGLVISAVNVVIFVRIWVAFRGFLRELANAPPVPLKPLATLAEQTFEIPWIGGFANKRQVLSAGSAARQIVELAPRSEPPQRSELVQQMDEPCSIKSVYWDAEMACHLEPVVRALDGRRLHDLAGLRPKFPAWRRAVDELFVSQLAITVSYVIQQLRNLLGLMLVNALLTAIAVSWYPLEPRRLLATMNWFMVVTVLVMALTVFIKTERDVILRHLRGKSERWIMTDPKFLGQMFVWIVLPFLAFLASQYPTAAGALLNSLAAFSFS